MHVFLILLLLTAIGFQCACDSRPKEVETPSAEPAFASIDARAATDVSGAIDAGELATVAAAKSEPAKFDSSKYVRQYDTKEKCDEKEQTLELWFEDLPRACTVDYECQMGLLNRDYGCYFAHHHSYVAAARWFQATVDRYIGECPRNIRIHCRENPIAVCDNGTCAIETREPEFEHGVELSVPVLFD